MVGFGSYGCKAERASGSYTITRPCSPGDIHVMWLLAWVLVVFSENGCVYVI